MMRLSRLSICLMLLPLGACATVDLADVSPAAKQAEKPAPQNVVLRTSKVLITKFEKRGWIQASSTNKVQTAASFLLRGMGDKTDSKDAGYVKRVKAEAKLEKDISEAALHVEEVLKAAEVYLAVSVEGDDLRPELKSLEKALAVCHQAEIKFKAAEEKLSASVTNDDIQVMQTLVLRLRDVTNIYGDRVRAQAVISYEGAS